MPECHLAIFPKLVNLKGQTIVATHIHVPGFTMQFMFKPKTIPMSAFYRVPAPGHNPQKNIQVAEEIFW